MLKPKSNEKPKKQIGYLKRAREMQELAHANFEPERGDKSLSRIHKNIIKPRFGNTYRTFLRAMNTDTSVIERLERERDERELCKLRDKNSWGVYDRTDSGRIYLEHMACDLTPIGHWLPLPSEYRYARRASRDELRDFFYLLGCDDTLAQATR